MEFPGEGHSGIQVTLGKLEVNFTSVVSQEERVAYCPLSR